MSHSSSHAERLH